MKADLYQILRLKVFSFFSLKILSTRTISPFSSFLEIDATNPKFITMSTPFFKSLFVASFEDLP